MKKLITKMLSLTLALAMCLSVTALAASDADIIAQREANPNWHAARDLMRTDALWLSVPGGDWRFGDVQTDEISTAEVQRIVNDKTVTIEFEDLHKQFTDYESPYGDVIETWDYLNDNFGTIHANGWVNCLTAAISGFESYRSGVQRKCDCGLSKPLTAVRANMQLVYLTEQFDNEVVQFIETYGTSGRATEAARDFLFARMSVITGNACKHNGGNGDINTYWVKPYEEVAFQSARKHYANPIDKTPEPPVANELPVETVTPAETATPVEKTAPANGASMTTITVNDKPVEFEAVLKNNTTYLKLRDIGTSTGFNVNWDGKSIAISRTDVFAAKTPDSVYRFRGYAEALPAGTVETRLIAEGKTYALESVVLTDANGGATTYFKLRDIARIMHFNVDWNAETGVLIYN